MILTPAQHLKAARQAHEAAHVHEYTAQHALERGDVIGASEALAEKQFHAEVAAHHEAHAAALTKEPEIEGLTDGPVHVLRANPPGDDAIVEG